MAKIIDFSKIKAGSPNTGSTAVSPPVSDGYCGVDFVCGGGADGGCGVDFSCGSTVDRICSVADFACGSQKYDSKCQLIDAACADPNQTPVSNLPQNPGINT
jgi:hypothetical protein